MGVLVHESPEDSTKEEDVEKSREARGSFPSGAAEGEDGEDRYRQQQREDFLGGLCRRAVGRHDEEGERGGDDV